MGAVVNAITVAVAACLGLLLKKGIPLKLHERLMQGLALCVMALGIEGAIQGDKPLVMILSMVLGAIVGEMLDIDHFIVTSAARLEQRFSQIPGFENIGQGLIASSMFLCIGSLTILGSLQSGLTGDNTTLYTKTVIDGIITVLFASSLGAGVVLSAIPVLVIEGSLIILAGYMAPYLTDQVIAEMICVGSILLIGLSLNMLKITELKILNFTPAMFFPILLMLFF
ncbi:DUF554 domain-containing protein [Vaginisenegalia massiliensis]|uniref:DUF554 domain-containing protein n=1 Tax=Vaginisenegalia massiliensis TaxID=2058294 RepID=UPI000F546DD2|nr:DUF554 domain-containing protein [Vaginisenegalia massiliensis]